MLLATAVRYAAPLPAAASSFAAEKARADAAEKARAMEKARADAAEKKLADAMWLDSFTGYVVSGVLACAASFSSCVSTLSLQRAARVQLHQIEGALSRT